MIAGRLRAVVEEYSQWTAYFAQARLSPIEIVYEDAMKEPQAAVAAVANLFGLDGAARIKLDAGIDLAIQRDAATEEWRTRFIAETGDAGVG